ncbi:reverse transcriptase domain, reverse transcriptase zinc-binding domain protein [Tanacetum coccineum]
MCFLCECLQILILAVQIECSPSSLILAIKSLSSTLDEWGELGLPRTLSMEMMNSVPAIFEVWEMARKRLSSRHIPTLRLSDQAIDTPQRLVSGLTDLRMLNDRDIVRFRFSLTDLVHALISNGAWRWPRDWLQADVVDWFHIVWFPHFVSRHAIPIWLIINQKLKTQDQLRQWDVGPDTNLNLLRCPLCDLVLASHSHLFFECSFSMQSWSHVHALSGLDVIPLRLADVVSFLIPISKGGSVVSVVAWILLAATTYYLWNERNSRLSLLFV